MAKKEWGVIGQTEYERGAAINRNKNKGSSSASRRSSSFQGWTSSMDTPF